MSIKFNLKRKHVNINSRRTIIIGHPKLGKSTLAAQLPNSLLLDLEGGSAFIDTENVVDLKQVCIDNSTPEKQLTLLDVYPQVLAEIRLNPPDYLIVDTITQLEQMGKAVGLILYKETPMGKNFKGSDVTTLDRGAGE